MERVWSIPENANIVIENWGENAIIYSSLSGETHLLNELAYEVLMLFQAGSETLTTLIDKLYTIFEVEDKADLELQIQKLMTDFENLGLIESTECEN